MHSLQYNLFPRFCSIFLSLNLFNCALEVKEDIGLDNELADGVLSIRALAPKTFCKTGIEEWNEEKGLLETVDNFEFGEAWVPDIIEFRKETEFSGLTFGAGQEDGAYIALGKELCDHTGCYRYVFFGEFRIYSNRLKLNVFVNGVVNMDTGKKSEREIDRKWTMTRDFTISIPFRYNADSDELAIQKNEIHRRSIDQEEHTYSNLIKNDSEFCNNEELLYLFGRILP